MRNFDPAVLRTGTNPHGDGGYIPMLDGWRAVAIVLVLLFHGFYNSDLTGYRHLQPLATLFGRTGALGVLVFFAISGYLITKRLLAESRGRGMFSVRAFYVKRVFRIVPPLAVYLLVLCLLFAAGVISLQRGDWAAPLFLSNYIGGSWYTSHFWSLSVEEHFYLFWPLCVVVAGWRRAMWVGIALFMVVGVWRPWELHHLGAAAKARALQHTDMRLDYIMAGCVVALLMEFYPAFTKRLVRIGSTAGLLVLFLLLLVTTRPFAIDLRSFQAVILTLMVCASSVANPRLPRLLLTNRAGLFLGKVSYSLYIWQELFLGPSKDDFVRSPLALPIKFAAALAVAYLSYRYVERPMIRYGRAVLAKRTSPVELTA